MFRDYADIVG